MFFSRISKQGGLTCCLGHAVLAAVSLLAIACGSPAIPDRASEHSADGSTTESKGDASYVDADSPLAAYIGFDINDPNAMVESRRLVEEKVQECMRAQGFEYETSTPPAEKNMFSDGTSMDDKQFAAEHGYGQVDMILASSDPGADDSGTDSNEAMLDNMNAAERGAWEAAAFGASPMPDEISDDGFDFEPEGCYGDAANEIYGRFAALEQLAPVFESMDVAYQTDSRVLKIQERWARCMGEAGYTFEDSVEAQGAVTEKINQVVASSSGVGEVSDEEQSAEVADPQRTAELTSQLAEVRDEEIAIATADAACSEADSDELLEINREYELKFIEDNKNVLQQMNSQ